MTGYRQSNFDPNAAWGEQGPPLRPFNWVQWTGVGFVFLGVLGYLLYFADKFGWIDIGLHDAVPFISLPLIGAALINSRRQPISPEQAAANRRRALIVAAVGVVACIVSAAITILIFKGA
jgi:hypothetical protein